MNVRLRPVQGLKRMEGMTNRAVLLAALGVGAVLVAAMVARANRNGEEKEGADALFHRDLSHENGRSSWRGALDRARTKVDEGRARVAGLAERTRDRFDRTIGELPPDSPLQPVRNGLGWVATHAAPGSRTAQEPYFAQEHTASEMVDGTRPTPGEPTGAMPQPQIRGDEHLVRAA
jgi:hypothetical protein